MSSSDLRYAYCKNGNVVAELRALGPAARNVPDGGPEHYIGSFLKAVHGADVLLISSDEQPGDLRVDRVQAHVLPRNRRGAGTLALVAVELRGALQTAWHLLRFVPI